MRRSVPFVVGSSWQTWKSTVPCRLSDMTAQSQPSAPRTYEDVLLERDLYRGLLELNSETDPERFIRSALELIVGTLKATRGYLELFEQDGAKHTISYALGFPDGELNHVRALVSQGIIGEAIATERVVVTPSAMLDPRFRDRESVRESGIDAVICAPIDVDPPRGILYLQCAMAKNAILLDQAALVERFARHLAPIAEQAVHKRRLVRASPVADLREKLQAFDLIGKSRALGRLLHDVQAVAHLDVSVLLSGETGTGKSQLARLIHRNSRRANGPYLELNCANLPDALFESELYGAMQGAYSGALRKMEGKVTAAAQGTLFLDEIAELSLSAQAKLLQLLQSKEYLPLGATRPLHANVRFIAASNVDLKQAVAEHRFRQDLYYRLQVVSIHAPSLAERAEDTALLALYLCERAQKEHDLPHMKLSPAALRAVETAVWPGNVRELSNAIEAATIRAAGEGLNQVEVAHLFPEGSSGQEEPSLATFQDETRRFQRELLRRALEASDWNVSAAARRLDITRAHVYNLIKSFSLQRQ